MFRGKYSPLAMESLLSVVLFLVMRLRDARANVFTMLTILHLVAIGYLAYWFLARIADWTDVSSKLSQLELASTRWFDALLWLVGGGLTMVVAAVAAGLFFKLISFLYVPADPDAENIEQFMKATEKLISEHDARENGA